MRPIDGDRLKSIVLEWMPQYTPDDEQHETTPEEQTATEMCVAFIEEIENAPEIETDKATIAKLAKLNMYAFERLLEVEKELKAYQEHDRRERLKAPWNERGNKNA